MPLPGYTSFVKTKYITKYSSILPVLPDELLIWAKL